MSRVTACALIVCVVVCAGAIPAAKQGVTYDLTGWRVLEMTSGRVVASGGSPTLATDDGVIRLSGEKLTLALETTKSGRSVARAQAVGRVRLFLRQGPRQKVETTSDRAALDPARKWAELAGNVKVTTTDPARFTQPMVLTGDVVTVYLEDQRIVAKSASGRSRLSASPLPGEKP